MLALEPLSLAFMIGFIWLRPMQPWLALVFVVPLVLARWIVHRRLWTRTPLDVWLIVFVALTLANFYTAPYIRWWWWQMIRPMQAIVTVWGMVEIARRRGASDHLAWALLLLGAGIGALALGSSQWSTKSDLLDPIVNLLPRVRGFPGAERGFNVNEIAGGIIWLLPFATGMMFYAWRVPRPWLRAASSLTFGLLALALFLGQSRFAIYGGIVASGLLIFALIPRGGWRWLALVLLAAMTVLETLLFIGIFSPDTDLESRDESSLEARVLIWGSALHMVGDHPLTGVGANMFRLRSVRAVYPVTGYEDRVLPHAHNEFLQVGADLGIPGMLLFAGWHVTLFWMVWRVWRLGDLAARAVGVSLLAGLLAHGAFGLGDAVTLWDRFIFVYWLMVGAIAAQYWLVTHAAGQRAVESVSPARPGSA